MGWQGRGGQEMGWVGVAQWTTFSPTTPPVMSALTRLEDSCPVTITSTALSVDSVPTQTAWAVHVGDRPFSGRLVALPM